MTRPIPLFRFVFAAYYATSDTQTIEVRQDSGAVRKPAKREAAHLVLVVENNAAAKPPAGAERALEWKIDG